MKLSLFKFTWIEILLVIAVTGVLVAAFTSSIVYYKQSPRASDAILSRADRALALLQWDEFAFSAPEKMEIGAIAEVDLLVGGSRGIGELKSILGSAGNIQGGKVEISDSMEAQLVGDGFEIALITPPTQIVGTKQTTRWKWKIRAIAVGKKSLHLSLNALLKLNDRDATKSVTTLNKQINISVTSLQGAWNFVEAYRYYLGGFFTLVILPYLGRLFPKKEPRRDHA